MTQELGVQVKKRTGDPAACPVALPAGAFFVLRATSKLYRVSTYYVQNRLFRPDQVTLTCILGRIMTVCISRTYKITSADSSLSIGFVRNLPPVFRDYRRPFRPDPHHLIHPTQSPRAALRGVLRTQDGLSGLDLYHSHISRDRALNRL
jgi:hypothetical protein